MRVTLCGTGAAGMNQARAGASIHVAFDGDAAGRGLLLDCGPGWLERFLAAGLDPASIGTFELSHLHFDHAMGLGELLTRWAFERFALPSIQGPRDVDDYTEQALAFARTQHRYLSGRQMGNLEGARGQQVAPGSGVEVTGGTLRAVEVPHASYLECLAWRVDAGGRAIVYSGDTRPAPDVLAPLAEGAGLLIHEAFSATALHAHSAGMPASAREGLRGAYATTHTPVREAARIAAQAGVPRLVLTHLFPEEQPDDLLREASAEFDGEVIVARDGLTLEV